MGRGPRLSWGFIDILMEQALVVCFYANSERFDGTQVRSIAVSQKADGKRNGRMVKQAGLLIYRS